MGRILYTIKRVKKYLSFHAFPKTKQTSKQNKLLSKHLNFVQQIRVF